MNRWQFALSLVVVGLASHAYGQDRNARKEADAKKTLVPAQVTPEMWIYSQEMRRYEDPQQAVRRKAELKAAQRTSRLAAMKWFGFSNARPQANPVPFMSVYSPTWIGNGYDRYDWVGTSWPASSLFILHDDSRR
jgi:hypothetical protein